VLTCTLPPSCHPPRNAPTRLFNPKELEAHYAKYHAHVCEESRCAKVFPDERLLELHQRECHDPIAAVRKERGEKIFSCFLSTCPKLFASPKNRRLHLIQAHGYPKEYFFAVTNKGIGGLLKKWGEGASLMRGTWHAREDEEKMDEDEENKDENEKDEEISEGDDAKPNSPTDSSSNLSSKEAAGPLAARTHSREAVPVDADALASSMSSLSLVPPSIRFGRGGSRQAFPSGHRARVASSKGITKASDRAESGLDGIEVEVEVSSRGRGRGRGRGAPRGRGRAGNREPPVIVTEGVE